MEAIDAGGHYPGKGSTGPKTAEGKARVARNALKHGLRAKKYVMHDEDGDGFQEYRIELMHELAPVGTVETFLTDRIAQTIWRLRRIMPMESEMFDHQRTEMGDPPCPLGVVFARPTYHGPRGIALLMRYETTLDRALARDLRELRTAQAQRAKAEADAEGEDGLLRPIGAAGVRGGMEAAESPAQWMVRNPPKEQVEAMIRDGWYVPPQVRTPADPGFARQSAPAAPGSPPAAGLPLEGGLPLGGGGRAGARAIEAARIGETTEQSSTGLSPQAGDSPAVPLRVRAAPRSASHETRRAKASQPKKAKGQAGDKTARIAGPRKKLGGGEGKARKREPG